jgi:hypothetical protein
MSDKEESPFGRQREPVEILLIGDGLDVGYYSLIIKRAIEGRGYDNVERPTPDRLKIHPAANND